MERDAAFTLSRVVDMDVGNHLCPGCGSENDERNAAFWDWENMSLFERQLWTHYDIYDMENGGAYSNIFNGKCLSCLKW